MKKSLIVVFIIVAAALLIGGLRVVRRSRHTQEPPASAHVYTAGDYRERITVDGRERTYLLHMPQGYSTTTQYPLVAIFHGGGGSGQKIASQTGFPDKADKEGFIAVFPDGIEHNWNDGRDTTDAYKQGTDDVGFIRALIEALQTKLSIDKRRIYATGVSNGGIFTHRLGCDMADVFAAAAPDVGSLAANLAPRCAPASPIAITVIQGTDDLFIPIDGGDTKHKRFENLGDGGVVLSAQDAMKFWAEKNGCSPTPTVTNIPPQVADGTSVTKTSYTQCRNSAEVTYYIVSGMGHGWPPHEPQVPIASGKTSQNINATETFWDFFKAHPKQ